MRHTGFFEDIRYDEASESRRFYAIERDRDPWASWDIVVGLALIAIMLLAAYAVGP